MFETKKKRELREREEERLENLRKVYGRMKAGYKFCPFCGGKLERRSDDESK